MALETATERAKPQLYTMYGKQYDYNEFLRDADSGVSDYIYHLNRGSKDYDEFAKAYRNLMQGIKDGTITVAYGGYDDRLGRYTNNTKDKSKDYYGLMAHYIYNVQKGRDEWVDPDFVEKEKWNGSETTGSVMRQLLFNSSIPDYEGFAKLDYNNTDKNKYSARNAELIRTYTELINNFDKHFSKYRYTPDEKDEAIAYFKTALAHLNENGFTDDDLYYMRRAANGLDYNTMYGIQPATTPSLSTTPAATPATTPAATTPTTPATTTVPDATTTPGNTIPNFDEWLISTSPRFGGTLLKPYNLRGVRLYEKADIEKLAKILMATSNDILVSIIKGSLAGGSYNFSKNPKIRGAFGKEDAFENAFAAKSALQVLKSRKNALLDVGNGRYWVVGTENTKRNTVLIWDKNANTLTETRMHDLPGWISYKKRKYNLLYNIQSSKHGGVLKAETGTTLYALNTTPTYESIGDLYRHNSALTTIYNMFGGDLSKYKIATMDNVDSRYTNGINDYTNGKTSTKDPKYGSFSYSFNARYNPINSLMFGVDLDAYTNSTITQDNDGNLTGGLAYNDYTFNRKSKNGDDPNGGYSNDFLGLLNFLRVLSITNHDSNSENFRTWAKFMRDLFKAKGAYYYVGESKDGRGLWVPTNDDADSQKEGYVSFDTLNLDPSAKTESSGSLSLVILNGVDISTLQSAVNTDGGGTGDGTGDKSGSKTGGTGGTGGTGDGTRINTREEFLKDLNNLFTRARAALPNLIEVSRLGLGINANNKIAKITKESINPVLKNTYERYSPVTGSFQEMQLRNKQASEMNSLASKAISSDALLLAALLLLGNSEASKLQYQGFVADNDAVAQSSKEALARQEDNAARRSEVANANSAAINEADKNKKLVEASRLKLNHKSIDTYLQSVESRLRNKLTTDENRRKAFVLETETSRINREYENAAESIVAALLKYIYEHDDIESLNSEEYKKLLSALDDLEEWRKAQLYKTLADIYNYNYNHDYTSKTAEAVKALHKFKKSGGKLIPRRFQL